MTACLGRRVAELADGRLVGDERERALAHVASCVFCREALEGQRQMRERLAAAAQPLPPEGLLDVLRLVPDRTPRVDMDQLAQVARRRHRRRALAAGASAAVMAVAMAGGVVSLEQTAAAEPVTGPRLSSFAAEHAAATGQLPLGGPALSAPQTTVQVVFAAQPSGGGATGR